MSGQELDELDAALLAHYRANLDALPADVPRVGDFVRFADGVVQRIAYIWRNEDGVMLNGGVQTSSGGSYHVSRYGCSMSGGLHPGVSSTALTPTDETKDGSVWFFHHEFAGAGRGVYTVIPFRVFACSLPSGEAR